MAWGKLIRHFILVVVLIATGLGTVSAYHSYILTVHELKRGLDRAPSLTNKGFFLIDVRTPAEHQSGYIPGTDLNIDFREIAARHREIGARLDDHIVVYCQSGRRSHIAAETLADLGYKYVYNVDGSMNAWEAAGYPVEVPRR
ncbi:MAG: rhodanese-like domain-containing protein [Nitrospirae bacterium]|nr:MAG: rhodanese-like domain-containing protein [Nitrospirota bacterium]